ncbi:hypothetical protein GS399_03170 [Pedobacter sp. HMF7647]|uniref:HTH domain-containing protein n=1 Tax=Hufsiella arboris TaxID=2695275 RepID=A0A7K1Y759_9SPHI|nr:hypothetical protein [Hufsiella arboris]MXV49959.1 hypothetical protein [Hufsiella arboris]
MSYQTGRKLDYLLDLVRKGRAQSPSQLAEVFGCSPGTAKRMIGKLRTVGHRIHFSKLLNRYILK